MNADGQNEQRLLLFLAWFEYRVAKQYSTGCGGMHLAATAEAPGWFRFHELGLGSSTRDLEPGQAPHVNVFYTLRNIAEINRANRAAHEENVEMMAPVKKRLTAAAAMKKQRRIAKSAGVRVRAARYVGASGMAA